MKKANIINDFLIYAIEEYRFWEKKNGRETIKLFSDYGVFDYIAGNYGALHTLGGKYITQDINLFIEKRKKTNLR